MIVVSNLSKNYGPKFLFQDVSLQLLAHERYGLVGANGSGKSTFLRILSDLETPSGGSVSVPKNARVGMLRQDQFSHDAHPVVEVAMRGDREVFEALYKLDRHAEGRGDPGDDVTALTDLLTLHDGYTLEARARAMLTGLGLDPTTLDRPLGTLSGGYKLRVLLAQVLLGRPDILLLDEPTNHLDILSIRWLEQFLQAYVGCAVIISHDRRFLDAVATRILDVDYETITDYPGNYTQFIQQKVETRARKESEIARAEREIAHKKAFIERFKAKASKARQAQSRVKQVEKIEIEVLPQSSRRYPKFRFEQDQPTGKQVLRAQGLVKSYGDNRVLGGVGFEIVRGERVAIIGPNGIGKSTLLRILAGRLPPDAGSFEWGHNVRLGYFAQDHHELLTDSRQTPLQFVWDACPAEPVSTVRGHLGRVLLSGDEVNKPASALSGGEAARVIFARLAVQKPNVLLLDEPTNHLDLESIEALTDALNHYPGTILLVSHDRHFVAALATRIIEVRREGLRDFHGSYDAYIEKCGDDHLSADAVVARARIADREKARPDRVARTKSALSWEEQKRLASKRKALPKERDRLLAEIEAAEKERAAITARYFEPTFYMQTPFAEIERLQARQAELDRLIERTLRDWERVETELNTLDDGA